MNDQLGVAPEDELDMKAVFAAFGFAFLSTAAVAGAQQAPRDTSVPPEARPPRGMCRVWINGVPPAQQPAPTDCASAVRNRPANSRVLFGDDYKNAKPDTVAKKPPEVKPKKPD